MIRDCQHVSITVSDADRSVAFYRDKLGFNVVGVSEASGDELAEALGLNEASLKVVVMEQGNMVLELIEYALPDDRHMVAPRPCDVGCMHMALEVDDIHALFDELSAQGVKFNTPPKRNPDSIDWAWWCYMQDPDGVPIELVQVSP
jgi:catechol 2,3-dioxygenase-like lactoylglutathione lyase family enzyme